VSERMVMLNGKLVPANKAMVSVFDSGFLHGGSTFTTMLARNGVIVQLDRHLNRLLTTVDLLGFVHSATAADLAADAYEVLSANDLQDARMRITLTPGSMQNPADETTLVTAEPLPDYPAEWYERGISVVISSFKQAVGDPTFGYKTGCYFPRVMARAEAGRKGAEEALWFTPDNHLAEACFCNVFLVDQSGTLRTPPRDTPVLNGTVRDLVLELCAKNDIPVDGDTPLTIDDLLDAAEVFVTASTSGIRPVRQIEQHTVGQGVPGPVTRKLMDLYESLLAMECQPPAE
jgi:branched-chain amino acid aminotransferase